MFMFFRCAYFCRIGFSVSLFGTRFGKRISLEIFPSQCGKSLKTFSCPISWKHSNSAGYFLDTGPLSSSFYRMYNPTVRETKLSTFDATTYCHVGLNRTS